MARPPSRRPGHNRKAQFGLFVSYVIAIFGALAGLFLLILSRADPTGFAVIRTGAAEMFGPVASGTGQLVRSIGSLDETVTAYVNAGSQNVALRRQVDANRPLLIEAQAIRQENVRLKKLLRLAESTDNEVATARLISSTSTSVRRIARISAGQLQGVREGMPVRAPEGLVGRVLVSGPTTSDILLLTDSQSVVPVRRAQDRTAGICTGRDNGTVEIRAVNSSRNPFQPGDIMVTTGIGGLFSPNIPVAIVVKVEDGVAIALPLASPTRVEAVLIQRPYDADIPPPVVGEAGEETSGTTAP